MQRERRRAERFDVDLVATQFIDNRPIRSQIANLSLSGLHACHAVEPMSRSSRHIQLEVPLPGSETLWIKGEIVFDDLGLLHHGTGVRFLAMAPSHERALEKWIGTQSRASRRSRSATGLRL